MTYLHIVIEKYSLHKFYQQRSQIFLTDVSGDMSSADTKAIHMSPTSVSAIQNVRRPIHSVPKSVKAVTHHKLPFTANWRAGLGDNGELILGDWDSERYLHKMQHNGDDYQETWRKKLPDGMEYHCYKGMSSAGCIFLQNDKDEKTVCYDASLTKLTELQVQSYLIDSSNDEVFYGQGTTGENDWQIIVHKTVMEGTSTSGGLASALQKLQLEQHRTLKPPSLHGWRSALSVCRTQQRYVVVELRTRSMDIFDEDGRKYFPLKLYLITGSSVSI